MYIMHMSMHILSTTDVCVHDRVKGFCSCGAVIGPGNWCENLLLTPKCREFDGDWTMRIWKQGMVVIHHLHTDGRKGRAKRIMEME